MYSVKRRRLDQSSTILNKPFQSPLRTSPPKKSHSAESVVEHDGQQSKEPLEAKSDPKPTPTASPTKLIPSLARTEYRAIPRTTKTTSTSRNTNQDPEYLALQKEHSALSSELTKLHESLDTARQALKIDQSNQDVELENLITKWKGIAREAAEELFTTAKDRVNRMGGVAVWRERSRKSQLGWQQDDEEDQDQSELTEEQSEQRAIARDEAMAEARKYGLLELEKPVELDDDSFTIDMMLKQMNVEMDVIGFDKKLQRWAD